MRACVVSFCFTRNHSISSAHTTQCGHLNETSIYSHRMDSFMKTNKQTTNTQKKDIIITHGVYSLNIAPCIGIPFIHTPTYKYSHIVPAHKLLYTFIHACMYIERSVIYVTTDYTTTRAYTISFLDKVEGIWSAEGSMRVCWISTSLVEIYKKYIAQVNIPQIISYFIFQIHTLHRNTLFELRRKNMKDLDNNKFVLDF